MTYYVQVASTNKWDEVSEEIYRNWSQYFNMDGTLRYNGNRFSRTCDNKVTMDCNHVPLTLEGLAVICRINLAEKVQVPLAPGGWVSKPDFLIRKKRNAMVLMNVNTGETFKKEKKAC